MQSFPMTLLNENKLVKKPGMRATLCRRMLVVLPVGVEVNRHISFNLVCCRPRQKAMFFCSGMSRCEAVGIIANMHVGARA